MVIWDADVRQLLVPSIRSVVSLMLVILWYCASERMRALGVPGCNVKEAGEEVANNKNSGGRRFKRLSQARAIR